MPYPVVMPEPRTQLIIRLPKQLRDCIDRAAEREFRSASAQVAAIVREWCERHEADHQQSTPR